MLEPVPNQPGQQREVWREGSVRMLPDTLSVSGRLNTASRQRGIYRTQVYRTELTLAGQFVLPANAGLPSDAVLPSPCGASKARSNLGRWPMRA